MRFFLISSRKNTGINQLLEESAHKKKIPCKVVFIEDFQGDFSELDVKKGDCFYRASDTEKAHRLEQYCFAQGAVTFYDHFWTSYAGKDNVVGSHFLFTASRLAQPRTMVGSEQLPTEMQLEKELGGFPVIVKLVGGQHGVGVIKIDTYSSLRSLLDVLHQKEEEYVLREFIPHAVHARIIVLGENAIDSITYVAQEGDFRTNAGSQLTVAAERFGTDVEQLAVKAVKKLGLEFGGADILINEAGIPYLLEVNYPCFFPRAQRITGVKISDLMLEYLQAKLRTSSSAG